MKKLWSAFAALLMCVLLTVPAWADIAPLPEPLPEPEPAGGGNPTLLIVLAVAAVLIALAVILRIIRKRRA